jgi:hypothetical protein
MFPFFRDGDDSVSEALMIQVVVWVMEAAEPALYIQRRTKLEMVFTCYREKNSPRIRFRAECPKFEAKCHLYAGKMSEVGLDRVRSRLTVWLQKKSAMSEDCVERLL